ncbi:hypothetical protein Q73A0000_14665 [Kaistella flava (ex Peng et al. 2021)]|uniref:DUF6759 domain-containing protein n=1 Tax=Kaistella flava (ex Peng et al. 2021) TaxID=2038776 RepID=A0A7M2YDQ3_9FLAO|nr:DUF6759 domain-containing protein [Kaistella flava (ex Peng et al. 2021)]QOW11523.1 hypothetical protein Q73A0000_14665 [Kaistella flava (ex Peng et al. 2021)]
MKGFYLLFSFLVLMSCDILSPKNTINKPAYSSNINNERREFATLISNDQINKKKINAEVVNYLLNDADPKEKNTAAVIENTSRCDMILRLVGVSNNKIYNLPISRNSKNQFIIEKGNYTLKSNIFEAKYYSQKNITEPLILKLSNN